LPPGKLSSLTVTGNGVPTSADSGAYTPGPCASVRRVAEDEDDRDTQLAGVRSAKSDRRGRREGEDFIGRAAQQKAGLSRTRVFRAPSRSESAAE
jgi:hypothetical protein